MRISMPLLAFVIVLPFVAAAEAQKEGTPQDELKKLQGAWTITKWLDSGGTAAPADELKGTWYEFDGDRMTKKGKEARRPVKYTLNPAKKPKWIDLDLGFKISQGIYKLDGDELTICLVSGQRNDDPPVRPTEFKANKDKHHTLFVLKKIKK